MVGWLIQQQQVGALPDDHRQHQAGLLAAAHGAYGLADHVAVEVEAAQVVAQILLARRLLGIRPQLLGQADHVGQRRVVGA
ncbi:hypothetical protein SDC9_152382 [bioreactor metagenome]|uniref:Uncharacterized protein n=1 Tax=bioreactor metagenome TaxID=1076179 RepID=A0A645EV73_9ZZZZ